MKFRLCHDVGILTLSMSVVGAGSGLYIFFSPRSNSRVETLDHEGHIMGVDKLVESGNNPRRT